MKIVRATPKRSAVPFRPRTARALWTMWENKQLKCNQFAEDHRASHIVFQSGGTDEDFRASASNFYAKKRSEVFDLEHVFDFLKNKPKWLIDTAHDARDRAELGTDEKPLPVNKKGGPVSKIEKRQRAADSEDEEGERVPGLKLPCTLLKQASAAAAS